MLLHYVMAWNRALRGGRISFFPSWAPAIGRGGFFYKKIHLAKNRDYFTRFLVTAYPATN